MSILSSLRQCAEDGDVSLAESVSFMQALEEDEAFLQECTAACLPTFIQMELMENAEAMDEAVVDAFHKVHDYMVGQGYLTEAAVNLNNPKVSVVKLSKESQIKRLKAIITLKMARKNNDPKYKKYKLGAKVKKENMAEMDKKYGTKAEKLARKLYEKNRKNRKVAAVVKEKKGKK